MKYFFLFIFNVLRNLSLIIVLLSGIFIFTLANDETFWQEVVEEAEKRQRTKTPVVNDVKAGELSSLANFETFPEEAANDEVGIMTVGETSVKDRTAKKIKIKITNGEAYLRPTQVMYFTTLDYRADTISIVTTDEKELLTRKSLMSLQRVLENESEECFFKTKSAVFNCNYVQQVISEFGNYPGNKSKYKYYVIMEDNRKISISEDKSRELRAKLDSLF